MNRPHFYYGNCVCCQAYNRLGEDGHCALCNQQEMKLLHTAQDIIAKCPDLSGEEIADLLGVDISKVEHWSKKGILHCVVVKTDCPHCGKELINRFSCRHCGFNLINELKESSNHSPKQKNLFGYSSSPEIIFPRTRNRFHHR